MVKWNQFRWAKVASCCLVVALLVGPVTSLGGTLSGKVTDRSDGASLFGAVLALKSTDGTTDLIGAATDEAGNYKIKEIPAGTYSVTISYIGFVSHKTKSITIPETGTVDLDAGLLPSIINMHALTVTASRRPEKVLEAPASVAVITSENIESRSTLTPTEHIKGLAGVDVATTGLNQSNVVVRGFNNIFSGALLVLTDNRIARVPSLRFNAHNFITTVNEDIQRVEVVSGPGSALYGPNAASGVMHIITKSPFGSEGTSFSFGGGNRDLMIGSFRHAGSVNNRVGYKISGQRYKGNDWEHFEKAELDKPVIRKYRLAAGGKEFVGDSIPNQRDFNVEKTAAEARVDFLLNENTTLILNGGFNRGSSIELTGLGAAQAIDWTYGFGQVRMQYKDLFVQGFVNASDAGDTYLLETGQLIVDKSKLWVAQVQHQYDVNDKLNLTYGLDALYTRPSTESTINGRNEDDDDIDEIGAYLQSEYQLSEKVKLVGAARIDDHNRLENPVFSPRAAIAYQPNENNNFRATYNRAFSSPDNNNLYLDILQNSNPFGTGSDIRVQGVPETGFHWNINGNGAQFRSPFAPAFGLEEGHFFEFDDPVFTNAVWQAGSGLALSSFQDTLIAHGLDPVAQVAPLIAAMQDVTPAGIADMGNVLRTFNPDTRSFDPVTVNDIVDIERLKPTITQTIEAGYKGIIGDRFQVSVDLYRTEKNDFVGPLTIETPNVFLNPVDLAAYLGPAYEAAYAAASAQDKFWLDLLDTDAFGGDESGSPVDELTTLFTTGATSVPFGTVTPSEAYDPTAVMVTYRNFGDVTYYGSDLALDYHLSSSWDVGGTYSYVSKNFFEKSTDQVHDIYLNAPRNKFGLHLKYSNQKHGFMAHSRFRWVEAFDMNSPFFGSRVKSYEVVDLNLSWEMVYSTRLSLTIQNLFDNKHSEFVGAPEIGRLAILRATYSL